MIYAYFNVTYSNEDIRYTNVIMNMVLTAIHMPVIIISLASVIVGIILMIYRFNQSSGGARSKHIFSPSNKFFLPSVLILAPVLFYLLSIIFIAVRPESSSINDDSSVFNSVYILLQVILVPCGYASIIAGIILFIVRATTPKSMKLVRHLILITWTPVLSLTGITYQFYVLNNADTIAYDQNTSKASSTCYDYVNSHSPGEYGYDQYVLCNKERAEQLNKPRVNPD